MELYNGNALLTVTLFVEGKSVQRAEGEELVALCLKAAPTPAPSTSK